MEKGNKASIIGLTKKPIGVLAFLIVLLLPLLWWWGRRVDDEFIIDDDDERAILSIVSTIYKEKSLSLYSSRAKTKRHFERQNNAPSPLYIKAFISMEPAAEAFIYSSPAAAQNNRSIERERVDAAAAASAGREDVHDDEVDVP